MSKCFVAILAQFYWLYEIPIYANNIVRVVQELVAKKTTHTLLQSLNHPLQVSDFKSLHVYGMSP